MNIREDKVARTISIELSSGDQNYVTLTVKGKDARMVEYIGLLFRTWVEEQLDDAVDAKASVLDRRDAALIRKEGG